MLLFGREHRSRVQFHIEILSPVKSDDRKLRELKGDAFEALTLE